MKVLQTLGMHGGKEGIFAYGRDDEGIHIDARISKAPSLKGAHVRLASSEWDSILKTIASLRRETFRLSDSKASATSLYKIIEKAVPTPKEGWKWNNCWKSYVSAILEHEGSVDIYGGAKTPIFLARDSAPLSVTSDSGVARRTRPRKSHS